MRSFATEPVNVSKLSSFRAERFPYSGPYPWLDRPDALDRIAAKLQKGELTEEQARQFRFWNANGYIIIKGLVENQILDSVWAAYQSAVDSGRVKLQDEPANDGDPHPGRFLNPHKKLAAFCQILKHEALLNWIQLLTEREPKILQTITSHKGSQQGIHSDSIHMTTYPLGYLTAAWVAFEDIHPDSGPLVFYPRSHRLPYVFSKDVGLTEEEYKERGYTSYHERYEPYIRHLVGEHGIEPHYFHASKGDTLIWHANLIHGGSARRDFALSRKALVVHFFVKGAFVYHDLAAAKSRQQYLGTCLLRDKRGKLSIRG